MRMPGVAMPWLVGYYGVFQAGHVPWPPAEGWHPAGGRLEQHALADILVTAHPHATTGRPPVTSGASRAAGATSRLTISEAPRKPAGVPIPWRCRRCGRTVDPKLRDVDGLCKACAIAARGRKAPID